eukprot:13387787-Heterocapsa_arctica.AAC.1
MLSVQRYALIYELGDDGFDVFNDGSGVTDDDDESQLTIEELYESDWTFGFEEFQGHDFLTDLEARRRTCPSSGGPTGRWSPACSESPRGGRGASAACWHSRRR